MPAVYGGNTLSDPAESFPGTTVGVGMNIFTIPTLGTPLTATSTLGTRPTAVGLPEALVSSFYLASQTNNLRWPASLPPNASSRRFRSRSRGSATWK